jgi:hypothetical protein
MRRRVKEKDAGVVRGVYYYRGRYWSALAWPKLNRPTAIADVPPPEEERGNLATVREDVTKGGSERTGEPVTAAGR